MLLCVIICTGGVCTVFSFWEKMAGSRKTEISSDAVEVWMENPGIRAEAPELSERTEEKALTAPIWKTAFAKRKVEVPETSENYRYKERFPIVLDAYGQFEGLYCEEYSTPVPGLENTSFLSDATDQMVPQGICIAENYMLITAYDKAGEENSVVYVLSNRDPADRELLTTLVLPDQNHVGGITCDGERVWIAKSSDESLSMITCDRIRDAVSSGMETVFLGKYDANFYCGVTASFVSYQDRRLWVGTSQSFLTKQGELTVFRMLEEDDELRLVRQFAMEIPKHAQGISFLEENGRTYLLLSASYGRFRDSSLYVYEAFVSDARVILRGKLRYTFPPMVEELVSDDDCTYCLFESAATCYSTVSGMKCKYPVDRVCALDNRRLVAGT